MSTTEIEEVLKSKLGFTRLHFIERKYGFINEGNVYQTKEGKKIFVKSNHKLEARQMFEGEVASLEEISKTKTVQVPNVMKLLDMPGDGAILAMDFIEMEEMTSAQNAMGKQLARLHLANQENLRLWNKEESFVGVQSKLIRPVQAFGFHRTTCCGFLPQYVEWERDWAVFYTRKLDNRISGVVQQYGDREVEELWNHIIRIIPKLFNNLNVKPALLHGDLWRGNSGQTKTREPVIFDPCCFYGHAEFDIATGFVLPGFDSEFYKSYHEHIPQDSGFEKRRDLYKLFFYFNIWAHFGNEKRPETMELMRKIIGNVEN